MREAGYFLLLSAALHVAGGALSNFGGGVGATLFPAVLYIVLFAGLARGWMLAAWLAFLAVIAGIAACIGALYGPTIAPAWINWAILGSNSVAAVLLFGAIWTGNRTGDQEPT